MSRLRTREIYRDATFRLLAVESIDYRHEKSGTGCHFFASIRPVAVIVSSADGMYALDMEATPTDIDQLRRDIAAYVPETTATHQTNRPPVCVRALQRSRIPGDPGGSIAVPQTTRHNCDGVAIPGYTETDTLLRQQIDAGKILPTFDADLESGGTLVALARNVRKSQ